MAKCCITCGPGVVRGKRGRGLNPYTRCMGVKMRAGKTMKQAAKVCKKKGRR